MVSGATKLEVMGLPVVAPLPWCGPSLERGSGAVASLMHRQHDRMPSASPPGLFTAHDLEGDFDRARDSPNKGASCGEKTDHPPSLSKKGPQDRVSTPGFRITLT